METCAFVNEMTFAIFELNIWSAYSFAQESVTKGKLCRKVSESAI